MKESFRARISRATEIFFYHVREKNRRKKSILFPSQIHMSAQGSKGGCRGEKGRRRGEGEEEEKKKDRHGKVVATRGRGEGEERTHTRTSPCTIENVFRCMREGGERERVLFLLVLKKLKRNKMRQANHGAPHHLFF